MQQENKEVKFIPRPEVGETQSHWLRNLPQEIKESWGKQRLKIFYKNHKS